MVDLLKRIFGENWKTTLLGVGIFVFTAASCIIGGGNVIGCLSEGWNQAFITGGAGLALGAQASRF